MARMAMTKGNTEVSFSEESDGSYTVKTDRGGDVRVDRMGQLAAIDWAANLRSLGYSKKHGYLNAAPRP